MYTKKILSAAAAVAIMATGAMAFDTDSNGRLYKVDIPDQNRTVVNGNYTYSNTANANAGDSATDARLRLGTPGRKGDALIFPAFFSKGGWQSDFTIINRGNNAQLVKVVLYSAVDSKELKDFNVYLSAGDVFRAKIKDSKIISTDDSTPSSTRMSRDPISNRYSDSVVMASEDKPFERNLSEDRGYIIAYAMAEVADVNQTLRGVAAPHPLNNTYHKKHVNLWKDYRHLIDSCRTTNWRSGINGGIYTAAIPAPDINITSCGTIRSTLINPDDKKADYSVTFQNPSPSLLGNIHLIGNDSKGTRAMKLNATPILNFTPNDVNMTLLWTEGEFASLPDRDIDDNGAGRAIYNETLIDGDAFAFINNPNTYIFEFGNSKEDAVIITQPLKRTLIQLDTIYMGSNTVRANDNNLINANSVWGGVTYSRIGYINFYGTFTLNPGVYNDSEDYRTLSQASFMVSPATTVSNGYPNEATMISDFLSEAGYKSGYAFLNFDTQLPAIVTQMSSADVDGNIETNWIYSARD